MEHIEVEENHPSTGSSPQPRPQSTSKKRKTTSVVWDYFIKSRPNKDNVVKVRCKKCPQEYVWGQTSGTTNMKRHLGDYPGIKETQMPRLPFNEEYFREMLAKAMVKHNLPFSFVEYEGIRDLFYYLNPDVVTISRNTSKADIWKLHEKEKQVMRDALKSVPGNFCLTTDLWTSITTDGYMALTVHYVDENWTLQKRVLNFRHVPPPHNGPALGVYLLGLLREWGIEKRVFTVTLDNASYNDGLVNVLNTQFRLSGSAICDGEFLHIHCGAHILNLIVQAGLKIIEGSVSKIRECVKYVRASEARKLNFARCIKEVSLPCTKKVRQDVPTRWNSTYLMIDSALYFRVAFEQLKNVDSNFKVCPSDSEWDKISEISKVLKPFLDITTLFSGSQYPTANLYFHGVWKIESLIISAMASPDGEIQNMAIEMKEKFDKYWECYSVILSFALMLDPRFKLKYVERIFGKLYSPEICTRKVDEILTNFKKLFVDYSRRSALVLASSPSVPLPSVVGEEIDDISMFEFEENALRRNDSEVDEYLRESRLPATQNLDILGYWKSISDRYPTLAAMARDILCIPITTVASESTFSIGGRVIGKFRSSLTPDIAEALVCTRDWLFGVEAAQNPMDEEDIVEDFVPIIARLDIS